MHKLFRLTCTSFLRMIGGNIHIHQKNDYSLPKQFLLIANHPSGYDLLLLNSLFQVYPLAQHKVRKWFLVGKIAEAAGTVFVNREHKNSRSDAKESCQQALQEGKNVLIYPEGGCYGKHLSNFKNGAFVLSKNTNIPLLPVYLQYEAENCFEWGEISLLRHIFMLITAPNKHVHCYIFDAIAPHNFPDVASYKKYVHTTYQKWQQQYRNPYQYDPVPIFPDVLGEELPIA